MNTEEVNLDLVNISFVKHLKQIGLLGPELDEEESILEKELTKSSKKGIENKAEQLVDSFDNFVIKLDESQRKLIWKGFIEKWLNGNKEDD